MNEYIYKSFSDKFESQKLRHDLLSDIRYPNDINYAIMDPTNVGGHLELSYVKNIYDNEGERNPYLQNMNPNARYPYCKPYWSDKEPNPFGYPLSLTQLGYLTQNPL
jgi:hypothetical protein